MNTARTIIIGGGATLVIIGGLVYGQLNNWFSTEPTGPGSGDEVPSEPEGPGSGDEVPNEPEGPGSGDEVPNEPEGPGSGDELPYEPEGPGSGDEMPYEPEGPGSGDEVPNEPEGPGSGDEVPADEPSGPGSGDEVPADEPTGPGSGDEAEVVGSCNIIGFGSTCVDYIGSYWKTIEYAIANCSGEGTWSTSPCPHPSMGGCNYNGSNQYEMTIWHYNYGGDPFDGTAISVAITACNSAGQTWYAN